MTMLKSASLESSLRRPDSKLRAILIYGADEARIRELASLAVRKLTGGSNDPFAVERLGAGDVAKSQGRLLDEVQSIPLLGGNKVIWIDGADDGLMKSIEPVLASSSAGNIIVAEAGSLPKSSALRQSFEESDLTWIVPVFEPDSAEAQAYVTKLASGKGLEIEPAAVALLVESCGNDLGLLRQEIEKLDVYCLKERTATRADVEAVGAAGGELRFDDAVDAVFGGDVERAEELVLRLNTGGEDLGQIAMACHRHAVRLQEFHVAAERVQIPEQVVRGARPAVFFKRVPRIVGQLRVWDLAELLKAGATLGAIVAETRTTPSLSDVIAMRGLLSLAQRGRVLRGRLQ